MHNLCLLHHSMSRVLSLKIDEGQSNSIKDAFIQRRGTYVRTQRKEYSTACEVETKWNMWIKYRESVWKSGFLNATTNLSVGGCEEKRSDLEDAREKHKCVEIQSVWGFSPEEGNWRDIEESTLQRYHKKNPRKMITFACQVGSTSKNQSPGLIYNSFKQKNGRRQRQIGILLQEQTGNKGIN